MAIYRLGVVGVAGSNLVAPIGTKPDSTKDLAFLDLRVVTPELAGNRVETIYNNYAGSVIHRPSLSELFPDGEDT